MNKLFNFQIISGTGLPEKRLLVQVLVPRTRYLCSCSLHMIYLRTVCVPNCTSRSMCNVCQIEVMAKFCSMKKGDITNKRVSMTKKSYSQKYEQNIEFKKHV